LHASPQGGKRDTTTQPGALRGDKKAKGTRALNAGEGTVPFEHGLECPEGMEDQEEK
jgi:hypothetical protein